MKRGDGKHLFKVTYCSIQNDHILATPEPVYAEIVATDDWDVLVRHIEKEKDLYGNHYKYDPKHSFGYWFKSNVGGVKIRPYRDVMITEL